MADRPVITPGLPPIIRRDSSAAMTTELRHLRLQKQRLIEGNGRLKDALLAAGMPWPLVVSIYLGLDAETEPGRPHRTELL